MDCNGLWVVREWSKGRNSDMNPMAAAAGVQSKAKRISRGQTGVPQQCLGWVCSEF